MQTSIYLFCSQKTHENLLPLSFTRPIADFRIGISTIKEKWERIMPADYRYLPVEFLREKFGSGPQPDQEVMLIADSAILPNETSAEVIAGICRGEAICDGDMVLAFKGRYADFTDGNYVRKESTEKIRRIEYAFDIFLLNAEEIKRRFPPHHRRTRIRRTGQNKHHNRRSL